jgi:hypothetical protein
MLISPATILWFVTDGNDMATNISAMCKIFGTKLPVTMKKNLQHSLSGKHKTRISTIDKFSNLLKLIINNTIFSEFLDLKRENIDFDKKYPLLECLKDDYQAFFLDLVRKAPHFYIPK